MFVGEDELLLSYTDFATAADGRATLAQYRVPGGTPRMLHAETEGSVAQAVTLDEQRQVLQYVSMPSGFLAVVVSRSPLSSSAEPHTRELGSLFAHSPFSGTVDFSFRENPSSGAPPVASLLDAAGKLCHRATAEGLTGDRYRLAVPAELPAGTYVLRVGEHAAVCIKH